MSSPAARGQVKKPGLFRRHSFSLTKEKEKSPAPSTESGSSSSQRGSSLWYDGDVDSSDAGGANRHSATYSYVRS